MFLWCFATGDAEMRYLCLPFVAGLLAHTHCCSVPDRQVPLCAMWGSRQSPHICACPWGWGSLRGARGCPLLAMPVCPVGLDARHSAVEDADSLSLRRPRAPAFGGCQAVA
uniref:Putative secreted protein n=1 Tax=Ixodes ricinus TaxID=34613 RepID=A0A147BJT7_IXORI